MTVRDSRNHLVEQLASLDLLKLALVAHIHVHVPMAWREEHVSVGVPQEDLLNLLHIVMWFKGEVSCEGFQVLSNLYYLYREEI